MQNKKRTTDVFWLNWASMLEKAEKKDDESFMDIPSIITRELESTGGAAALREWQVDEPLWVDDDHCLSRTVAWHLDNDTWAWSKMIKDMIHISQKHREIIFMLRFQEGDASENCFLHGGRFTTVLIETEKEELIECY